MIKKFNEGNFTQRSANLKIKYYNPKNLIVQHLPKKNELKKEINCLRSGYIVHTLPSVGHHEIVKIGGKVIETYEGVIYRKIFKVYPFKKVIDKLFELRQKYKVETNDIMQLLVELIMNGLYGEQIRKDVKKVMKVNLKLR